MAISDWRPEDRPRERLLASGAGAMSDAELVAILLRTGLPGKSAVDLARDLLKKYKGIAAMLEAGDLETVSGLGPAKRAQFAAAIELLWLEPGALGVVLADLAQAAEAPLTGPQGLA